MKTRKIIIDIPEIDYDVHLSPMQVQPYRQRYIYQLFDKDGKKYCGGVTHDIVSIIKKHTQGADN